MEVLETTHELVDMDFVVFGFNIQVGTCDFMLWPCLGGNSGEMTHQRRRAKLKSSLELVAPGAHSSSDTQTNSFVHLSIDVSRSRRREWRQVDEIAVGIEIEHFVVYFGEVDLQLLLQDICRKIQAQTKTNNVFSRWTAHLI